MNTSLTKRIAYAGVMTALCAVCTMFISIPSLLGGHTNLSDMVIYLAAALLDPVSALVVGGVGTLIADLIAYPVTALFSLVFHGLEGLVAGLLVKTFKDNAVYNGIAFAIGGIIMIVGFFFAKAFYYGTLPTALESLWRNILQVVVSIVLALTLLYPLKLKELSKKLY